MSSTETARKGELFGHPRGLTYLFTTEMAERFSYYGMRAILVLYLTKYLLLSPTDQTIWGYQAIKGFFESFAGPLDPQPFSSLIYGTYTGLVYFTPIIGGWLADQVFGQRKMVIAGAIIMAAGEFALMVDQAFFVGLLLLIIGNGCFKPNISTQVGALYQPGDSRIDRAFSIFYVGINIGAFFSPLIAGSLGENVGWHWGFCAAGVGMVIGLLIYLFALRTLPPDNLARRTATAKAAGQKKKLTGEDWKAVLALIVLCVPAIFFWATYEQQGNTLSLFADANTDRRLIPGILNWEIPVTWFQAFNPFMIFAFTPFIVALWGNQAKRGKETSTVTKMAMGCIMVALSYLVLAAAVQVTPEGAKATWLWLFAFFALITLGELYVSPVGLSLFARVAPIQVASVMMGCWLATSFLGNFLAGYIGSYWEKMDHVTFFLMCAAIIAIAGVVVWFFNAPLKPILDQGAKPEAELKPAPDLGQ
jgi:POT family proton-dependent oligopeptide transporter